MKYRHFVSVPGPLPGPPPGAGSLSRYRAAPAASTPVAAPVNTAAPTIPRGIHRTPPVVQLLSHAGPAYSRPLANAALQAHLAGGDARAVCDAVSAAARRLGFTCAVRTHDVYAAGMPSFPGVRVLTTLVMVDLVPA